MFKAIIIDDNQTAIDALKNIVINYFTSDIQIIAYSTNFKEELFLVKELSPDIIFLDIDLGNNLTGFDFLHEARKLNQKFNVIFSTAFNQFAVKAIKDQAFDYILKPVDIDDLQLTIERLKVASNQETSFKDFIIINNSANIFKLYLDDIIYIEADGAYTHIISDTPKRPFFSPSSLFEMNEELKGISTTFFRNHNRY